MESHFEEDSINLMSDLSEIALHSPWVNSEDWLQVKLIAALPKGFFQSLMKIYSQKLNS